MPKACLSRGDFSGGAAPRVCPVTGQAAARRWDLDARTRPRALWALPILGPFAWLVAHLTTTKTVVGTLWLSEEGFEAVQHQLRVRARARTGAVVGGLAAGILSVGLAGFVPDPVRGVLGAGGVVTAVAVSLFRVPPIKATLDDSGRWVTVDDVHPAFAEAAVERIGTTT